VRRNIPSLDGHGSPEARAAMDTAQPTRERRGLLIVLSSPSGAGKSTISRILGAADKRVTMSGSATALPKRPGETDGVDYRFVDAARNDRMI